MDLIKSVTFEWVCAGPAYSLDGRRVCQSGNLGSYQPVIGGLEMLAGQGKYYYEIETGDSRCKLGVCVEKAPCSGVNLWEVELRTISPDGVCVGRPSSVDYCLFNCLTCAVELNGVEIRKLWRSFVPVVGARFGFLVDTDEGTVQLYASGEYQGLIVDAASGFKGMRFRPCVALEGTPACSTASATCQSGASVVVPRKIVGGLI